MRSLVTLCACFGSAASLTVEVLRSEFDAHGYHLVMARGPIVRHIQFKTGLTVSGRRGRTFKEGEDERLYLFRTDSALGNKYTELPPGVVMPEWRKDAFLYEKLCRKRQGSLDRQRYASGKLSKERSAGMRLDLVWEAVISCSPARASN